MTPAERWARLGLRRPDPLELGVYSQRPIDLLFHALALPHAEEPIEGLLVGLYFDLETLAAALHSSQALRGRTLDMLARSAEALARRVAAIRLLLHLTDHDPPPKRPKAPPSEGGGT